jgi:hypothetical protein
MRRILQAWRGGVPIPEVTFRLAGLWRGVAAALFAGLTATSAGLAVAADNAADNSAMRAIGVKPSYEIWAVKLGQPVTQIPYREVVNTACGTNGGPPSLPLAKLSDFAQCPPEPSGLREIYFQYDDEQKYIAKALELDAPAAMAGTSVYGHPAVVSVLVDDKGIVRGIRIITDDHATTYQRRTLYTLANNLKLQYKTWPLDCKNIPAQDGEQSIGNIFVHFICTATNQKLGERLRIEARYYRRKGETAIDPRTRQVQRNNFESLARFELDQLPYQPSTAGR